MACKTAKRYVLEAIPAKRTVSAEEIFQKLNWWTLATVEEAIAEMVNEGRLIKFSGDRYMRREGV